MRRSRSLNSILAVIAVVAVSFVFASVALASHASPFSLASESHQVPMNGGAFSVARDWLPYTVQPGESLVEIADRFGIPVVVLAQTNGISDFENLSAGQVVWIPMLATEVISVAPSYVKATSTTVLYAAPSAEFSIAAKMRAGEAAIVLGRSMDGQWLYINSVSSANTSGWVMADSALFKMFALPVMPR